jgi:hypothetical protein
MSSLSHFKPDYLFPNHYDSTAWAWLDFNTQLPRNWDNDVDAEDHDAFVHYNCVLWELGSHRLYLSSIRLLPSPNDLWLPTLSHRNLILNLPNVHLVPNVFSSIYLIPYSNCIHFLNVSTSYHSTYLVGNTL